MGPQDKEWWENLIELWNNLEPEDERSEAIQKQVDFINSEIARKWPEDASE